MSSRSCFVFRGFIVALIAVFPFLLLGCAAVPRPDTDDPTVVPSGKRVAFLGLEEALPPGLSEDVLRDPVSGALFTAGPVPPEAIDLLNTMILERLALLGDDVITPEESSDFLSSEMGKDIQAERSLMEIYMEAGRAMETDGVLVGHVYRWHEREGTGFAVERPASAAFDLNLIRSSDGALVWRGKFDRTQRSLAENVLDFFGFLRRGARWQKVEAFAASGLDALFKDYPGPMPEEM